MPTELQWERFITLVQILGQTRWCIFNVYQSGDILFVEARHCDSGGNVHLYLFAPNGEIL